MTASGRSISTSRSRSVIFVEGFRLLFVLAGAVTGFEIGKSSGTGGTEAVVGLLLGAGVSYVLGGIAGRLLDKGLQRAVFQFRNTPPGEVFAASIISTTGMMLGLVLGLPLMVLVRSGYAFIITAGMAWVLASLGWRLGSIKGRQIVAAVGLSRILSPRVSPPEGHALLVDGSAVMDRFLLVLGRAGLLPGRPGDPPVRRRPRALGGRVPRSGHLAAGPSRARVAGGAPGDVGRRPHRPGRGSRGRRPHGQAAHGGPPHRIADRDLLDDRRRGRPPPGSSPWSTSTRSPASSRPTTCPASSW